MFLLFKTTSTSFLPNEDQGIIFGAVQLPEGATVNRTNELLEKYITPLKDEAGVLYTVQITGFSMLGGSGENLAFFIMGLDPWSERKADNLSVEAIQQRLQAQLNQIPGAQVNIFAPPAISGIGNTTGLDIRLQAINNNDPQKLQSVMNSFIGELMKMPEVSVAFSGYAANTPHLYLDVDRVKAQLMNVEVTDIFSALQSNLGSRYINDVNFDGQVNKAIIQADWEFRKNMDSLDKIYVRSKNGAMVPLGSLITSRTVLSPRLVERYNKYSAATINAILAPGVSSGVAMEKVAELARKNSLKVTLSTGLE